MVKSGGGAPNQRSSSLSKKENMQGCFTALTWLIACDDTTKPLIIILVGAALPRPSQS